MGKKWLPLEANPDVMKEYTQKLGANPHLNLFDVSSCSCWEEDLIGPTEKCTGLLLLYPIKESNDHRAAAHIKEMMTKQQTSPQDLWFTKQTVSNACGTVALLHLIANNQNVAPCVHDSFFETFFKKTMNMSPTERAKCLEEDSDLEKAHLQAEAEGQSAVPHIDQKVDKHFVAFVEFGGSIYEMDGRNELPILHGKIKNTLFLDTLEIVQKEFIEADPGEMRFSLIGMSMRS